MDNIDKINKLNDNGYFKKINKSSVEKFVESQKGFLVAIDYWSKLLGLMVARSTTYIERLVFVNNLHDEHGKGDINNSHVRTFKRVQMNQ